MKVLNSFGYQKVLIADDGTPAIKLVRASSKDEPIDVIFMDMEMPVCGILMTLLSLSLYLDFGWLRSESSYPE